MDSPEQERLEMAVISANKTMPEIPRETTVTLETCFTVSALEIHSFDVGRHLRSGPFWKEAMPTSAPDVVCRPGHPASFTFTPRPQGSETPPVEKLKIEETPGLLGGAEDDDEDDVEMEVQSESEDEEVEVDETGGEFDMEIHVRFWSRNECFFCMSAHNLGHVTASAPGNAIPHQRSRSRSSHRYHATTDIRHLTPADCQSQGRLAYWPLNKRNLL